ncbi:hypothetical protein Ddye_012784 [Dipteronia dyeriana]|uniref:Phytocyanin domain-containing protein n=1 Tax=Dipteronia dyeriana TaxID=168575 RepID=A0AAD9X5E4_9ROSI|nr:hypothetical protein Ddye_012784 [Dipteronia dyeriana]
MEKMLLVLVVVMTAISCLGGKLAHAQLHHVVGGDRGWESSTDVAAWSSGRVFRVGDKIWFTYSAAQESIAELKSKEEYESCDVTNPIRMFTDGLNSILLEGEGIRYFVSSKTDSCKSGLKLHVEVMPQGAPEAQSGTTSDARFGSTLAAAPTTPTPSGSVRSRYSFALFLVGFWLCYMGF